MYIWRSPPEQINQVHYGPQITSTNWDGPCQEIRVISFFQRILNGHALKVGLSFHRIDQRYAGISRAFIQFANALELYSRTHELYMIKHSDEQQQAEQFDRLKNNLNLPNGFGKIILLFNSKI